jgi:hypothetical protein
MDPELAETYLASFAPDKPKQRMLHGTCENGTQQRNVENVLCQAPASDFSRTAQGTL